MRLVVGVLTCVMAGGLSNALADPPTTPQAASSPTAAVTPASPASAAVPATASTVASSASVNPDADDKRLRSQGYKPEMRGGTKVYCKSEPVLGSRLKEIKHCGTPADLANATNNARELTETSQRIAPGMKSN